MLIENGVLKQIEESDIIDGVVNIPSDVITIASNVWDSTLSFEEITEIRMPDTVREIKELAFKDIDTLKKITVPESVKKIGGGAFRGCVNLEDFVIEGKNTEIILDKYSFVGYENLKRLEINGNIRILNEIDEQFDSYETIDLLYKSNVDIERKTKKITRLEENFNGMLQQNQEKIEFFSIPNGVIDIGEDVFSEWKSLKKIEIPDGVKNIGEGAFFACKGLEKIKIPNSVTEINAYTFGLCINLSEIEIPSSVTNIGKGAFCYCEKLREIKIPSGVTSIGARAFEECTRLEEIKIPEGITTIDNSTFYNCKSLKRIEIPDNVTCIGIGAFSRCESLEKIDMTDSVTQICGRCVCRMYKPRKIQNTKWCNLDCV